MEARLDDVEDVLDGERLEVEAAGGVIVRRHRLRVAVEHDRLEAGVPVAATRSDLSIPANMKHIHRNHLRSCISRLRRTVPSDSLYMRCQFCTFRLNSRIAS